MEMFNTNETEAQQRTSGDSHCPDGELEPELKAEDINFEVFLKEAALAVTAYASDAWSPIFSQSLDYENFLLERFDALLNELLQQEEVLKAIKSEMLEKLKVVSRSLQQKD
ncbi:unnamed protein product [Clavelina lepadiformis]|uniref:Uncharacterized protein n=1 Tax=Clavelina lepadiformis TaxID=159417 RepID=A0ABP0GEF8_CLALP